MSRKSSTFRQLVEYCEAGMSPGDDQYSHFQNMHFGKREQIIRDFMENAELMSDRANGVHLYHEILSLSRSEIITPEQQKEILMESVQEYLSKRAPDCMAYSVIHDEKDNNVHAHIIISANTFQNSKRHRLTKSQFEKAKRETERFVLEKYPSMQQEITIDKQADRSVSRGESELTRRGGRTTQKDKLHSTLRDIFDTVSSTKELESELAKAGLAMSYRGGNKKGLPKFGKADSQKHYRLNTLGLETQYAQLIASFEASKDPLPHSGRNNSAKEEKVRARKKAKDSAETMEKATPEKPVIPRSAIKEDPWQAEAEKRLKEAQMRSREPSARDKVTKSAKEWFFGDFKARDEEAKRAKYKKQNEADAKVRSHKEQSSGETIFEKMKEVVAGDFTARDARARQAKFNKLKKNRETVKDKNDQSYEEKLKEGFDEYVKGDFSTRDARSSKEASDERLEKFQERKNQAEKEAREDWMREDETSEFINKKVDALDKDTKERLLRAQEAKDRFKNTRKESEKTKERDRGKERGRWLKGVAREIQKRVLLLVQNMDIRILKRKYYWYLLRYEPWLKKKNNKDYE